MSCKIKLFSPQSLDFYCFETKFFVCQTGGSSDVEEEGELATTVSSPELKRPSRYKVILHNDDYTTMEFVIFILKEVFRKSGDEAEDLMLKIHHEGEAVCGVYIYEIADTKREKVFNLAKKEGHPLRCSILPEDE